MDNCHRGRQIPYPRVLFLDYWMKGSKIVGRATPVMPLRVIGYGAISAYMPHANQTKYHNKRINKNKVYSFAAARRQD